MFGLTRSWKRAQLVMAIAIVIPCIFAVGVTAQEIRGTVRTPDGAPASGVVMVLLHQTVGDSIVARVVSNNLGVYALKSHAGTVRLRALRIGFEPMDVGTYTLVAGVTDTVPVTLTTNRVRLATVSITSSKHCDVHPDDDALVAKLFVEARTALLATTAQVTGTVSRIQYTNFTRYEDMRGRLTSPIERVVMNQNGTAAYGSASIGDLSKRGYVVDAVDGATYFAPDANILLSDAFAAQHCLQLVNGTGDHAGSVGIGFKPVNRPHTIVDVTGTLWLDRQTYELQYLEYQYDALPDELKRANVGGRVEYTRMSDGVWFISRWSIRTPMTFTQTLTFQETRLAGKNVQTLVTGLKIIGGEVQTVRVDDNILYASTSALAAGASRDDIMGIVAPTAGKFVPIPAADERALACGAGHDDYIGSIRGKVVDARRLPMRAARVTAVWQEEFRQVSRNDFTWQDRTVMSNTSEDGGYALCELPVFRAIAVSAIKRNVRSYTATVKLAREAPSAEIDLGINVVDEGPVAEGDVADSATNARVRLRSAPVVDPPHAATLSDAHNSQLEVTDALGLPIAYAAVAVNGITRVTDEHGVVFLNNVRGDSLTVRVRRVSYAAFQGRIARTSSTEPFRLTLLPSAQPLKTVRITDRSGLNPLVSTGFYERMQEVQKGASTGEFFTPEDLDDRMLRTVTQFLSASKYAKIVQYIPPTGGKIIRPVEMVIQGRMNCYMSILVDGVLIHQKGEYGGAIGSDIIDNMINMASVAAIEVYPSVANAPISIASKVRGAACGIVAIWTGGR